MNPHYDEDALLEYVEGNSTVAAEIEAHAASCSRCASEIEEQRQMIAAMASKESWEHPASATESDRNTKSSQIGALKQRLDEESAAARSRLSELLKGPSSWWRTALRKEPSLRTAGMVRALLDEMRSMLERVPADALVVTTLATEIAEGLSVAHYPSDFVIGLRAQSLRDLAFVLSFIGRFPDARAAADSAERLFRQTPVPDYELARLDLVRANIYVAIDRIDESVALSRRAAETFLRFGDRKAAVDARIYEGAMLYERRDYSAALEVWSSIEPEAALAGDTARIGLVHNLGICYRETGDLEKAARYLSAAAAEFEMAGLETHRVKSRWALATTLAMASKHEQAIPLLRTAWREFESHGMEADAALAALELAESLLVVNRTTEVPAICRALLDRFTRLGMSERAIVALAFLRESVASGHATPLHVRHVHDFLRDLPAEGERLFAPPPLRSLD